MNGLPEYIILAAAVAGALVYLIALVRKVAGVFEAVARVVTKELQHNGGGSMKDDVSSIARSLKSIEERVEHLEQWASDDPDRPLLPKQRRRR